MGGFVSALPALFSAGASVLSGTTIGRYLNLALGIIMEGVEVVEKLNALNRHVKRMVEEGRDPTEQEWLDLISRSDAAHAIIQNEVARRRGG